MLGGITYFFIQSIAAYAISVVLFTFIISILRCVFGSRTVGKVLGDLILVLIIIPGLWCLCFFESFIITMAVIFAIMVFVLNLF